MNPLILLILITVLSEVTNGKNRRHTIILHNNKKVYISFLGIFSELKLKRKKCKLFKTRGKKKIKKILFCMTKKLIKFLF